MSVAEVERPACSTSIAPTIAPNIAPKRNPATWWTPDDDAVLVDGRQRGLTYRSIGDLVGRSRLAVVHRSSRLSHGVIRYQWSRPEDARLISMLEGHRSWIEIAEAMGRSRSACQARAALIGISFRTAGGYTLTKTCRLLGIDHRVVARWERLGLLRVHRSGQRTGKGAFAFVDHDDLVAFLASEDSWHHWEPERITDSALREWAMEQRRGLVFLTTTEAAPLLYMTPLGVQLAIREGRLRAVRRGEVGDRWLIRSDWIREPDRRSLKGVPKSPSFGAEDLALVRRWWGRRPATWIAGRLGRGTDTAIHAVARRLGLPRLGRGCWKIQAAREGNGSHRRRTVG